MAKNPEGITSEQWAHLIERVRHIEPRYSLAEAEAFLNQFNYANATKVSDYQSMLEGIEETHVELALVDPGPLNHGYHSPLSWTMIDKSTSEQEVPPPKKVKMTVAGSSQPLPPADLPESDPTPVLVAHINRAGIPPKKWQTLITKVKDIQPNYSYAEAEAFLDLFTFPEDSRIQDYEQLLRDIQDNGMNLVRMAQQQRERNREKKHAPDAAAPVEGAAAQVAADDINVVDSVYYTGETPEAVASFKTSEDYAQFIAEYHQAVDKIVEFYTANVDDQENTTLVSENFKVFKKKIENSDDQDSHRYYQVKSVLEEIARLLVQPNTPKNPLNNKLAQIYELADRIIYCADGATTDILRASSNLFAPSPDLLSNMQKIKEKIAVNTLLEFMVQHAINNNIHTFNAFWDHFHQKLALPGSQDRFRNLDLVTPRLVARYRKKLTEALTPYRITYQLAQDHLDFFRRQLTADRVNYDQIEAKAARLSMDIKDPKEGFKPGYKNLDLNALFIQDDGKYQLRQEPILLQIEMAKKFSKVSVQAAWLNWSIQHLNNEQGNTFQRIGDLFWQETDGEVMLPTIKNIGNFIHQISFGQLMLLIEQARDEVDQALLRKIDPQRFQGANTQQINLFFSKLGLNGVGAINYAVAHRHWFQTLDNNPLISAIFQLDGTLLANLPAMLLHKMTASELSQFVEKLGDEESIRYAIKNLDWFQQLDSNPLIPVLLRLSADKLPLVSIDLLHHITDQQASLFFSQMGVKEGIAYATRNFEWFLGFKNNPLLPLLLRLPHEQLMQVSDMLFHQMSSQQASQVFSHWGINDSLHYIRNNFEWFQRLAPNPFVPILTKLTDHQLARLSPSLWHFMTVTTLCDLFEKRNNPNAAAYINYYINGSSFQDNQIPQNRLNNFQNRVLKALLINIVIIKIHGMNNAITGQTINTPSRLFLLAINAKDRQTIELLLTQDELDLKQRQYGYIENPLFAAIRTDQTWLVSILLAKHPLSDYQDAARYNVLSQAIENKNLQMLTVLLEAGADPNEKNLLTNTSILEAAVLSGDPLLVSKLLEYQAKDDRANALMLAIKQVNVSMVEALVAPSVAHYHHHSDTPINIYEEALALADKQPWSSEIIRILEQNKAHLTTLLPAQTIAYLFRRDVMSTVRLHSHISVVGIDTLGLPLYKQIYADLDKLHTTTGAEQIETAFILLKNIDFHLNYLRDDIASNGLSVISTLQNQINQVLFTHLSSDPLRKNILDMMKLQPFLAADIYQSVLKHPPATRLTFINFIFGRMMDDIYCDVPAPFRHNRYLFPHSGRKNFWHIKLEGFNGSVPNAEALGFKAVYHFPFSGEFHGLDTILANEQEMGALKKIKIDHVSQLIHVGYSEEELNALYIDKKGARVRKFLDAFLAKLQLRHEGDQRNPNNRRPFSVEEHLNHKRTMLATYGNKDYLRRQQKVRLARIERVYKNIYSTNIAAWDRQYSGEALSQLNQQLAVEDTGGQLALLLAGRQGLLINGYNQNYGYQPIDSTMNAFIIQQIDTLKALGVSTLGLPLDSLTQSYIDRFQQYPNKPLPGYLRSVLNSTNFYDLFMAASQKGLKVVALGQIYQPYVETFLQGMVNAHAEKILTSLPAGEKFVAIGDSSLLLSSQGYDRFLPGIAHRLGLPVLQISDNQLSIQADDVARRISRGGLSAPVSAKRGNVEQWAQKAVNTDKPNKEGTRFDGILILQLEDDPDSMEAAAKLAAKHPEKSVLFQRDLQSNLRLVHGNPVVLNGNVRWHVVGHGRGGRDDHNHTSLAEYLPFHLSFVLEGVSRKLNNSYGINSAPKEIVLMGCALASSDPEFNDYRTQLEQFLNRKQAGKSIEVPIKVIAYRTTVDVDSRGRRLTLGSYHQLQRKRAENRFVAGQWGMTSAQWSNLIGWVQRIEPTYSHSQAEDFLNQFDYASDVRLSQYQLMLQRIEQEGINLASVKPNAKDSDASPTPTRSERVMESPPEEQEPLAKRARIEAVAPPEPLHQPAPSTSQPPPVNSLYFLHNRDYWTKRVIEKFSSLEQGKQQALQILQTLYPAENDTETVWRSFNMSGELRQQFVFILTEKKVVPTWAQQHKVTSMDPNNPNRFQHLHRVIDPILLKLQTQQTGTVINENDRRSAFDFSDEFIAEYNKASGYQTNSNQAFFSTVISGAFRGTLRTPYALATDGKMLASAGGHTEPQATDLTFCASTAYQDVKEYVHDNAGRAGQFHSRQDDPTYSAFNSDSDYDSGIDQYEPIHRKQKKGFVYLIDTRGLDVVPIADNAVLNRKNSTVGNGTLLSEVHISVPANSGIASNRLWLVSSNGESAVNLADLLQHFEPELYHLEERTLAGEDPSIYDRLFYKAQWQGLRVLNIGEITRQGSSLNIRDYQHPDYPLIDHRLSSLQPVQRDDVDRWVKPKVNIENAQLSDDKTAKIRVIIQLENEAVICQAASDLADKHPSQTVVFQRDVQGKLRLLYGDLPHLSGALELFFVGHGRGGESDTHNNNTLAGYDAQALAAVTRQVHRQLGIQHHIHQPISKLILAGCALVNDDQKSGFLFDFAPELLKQNSKPITLVGYSSAIKISGTEKGKNSGHRHQLTAREGEQPARSARISLTLDAKQNRYLPTPNERAGDLSGRLRQVMALVEDLKFKRKSLATLTTQQQHELADFFHDDNAQFSQERLQQLLTHESRYRLWHYQAAQLLQLRGVHRQLAGMSGQKALEISQAWDSHQVNRITDWQAATLGMKGVKIDLAPQALFIDDASAFAYQSATAAAISWLHHRAQGTEIGQNYLNGLNTYAEINQQHADEPLSDNDRYQLQQFRQRFDALLSTPEAHPDIFIRQPLPTTYAEVPIGDYLLTMNQQVLTLSVSHDPQGQRIFHLYDANTGVMRIENSDASQNEPPLNTILQRYIVHLPRQSDNLPVPVLYKVAMKTAKARFTSLASLQSLCGDFKSESQRLAAAQNIILSDVTISPVILQKMGARIADKVFCQNHLAQLTPLEIAQQLRFDAKKLARYLHQADYTTVQDQQAVCFLKQQIISKGIENILAAGGKRRDTISAQQQLEIINHYVTLRPADGAPLPSTLDDLSQSKIPLQLHIDAALEPAVKNVLIMPARTRLQSFTRRAGNTMQGYGYLRSLRDIAKYNTLLKNQYLSAEQRKELIFEKELAVFSLVSNVAIDLTQEGLGLWGRRLSQLGIRSGFKLHLARFGAPLLGVLSSGFDIYQAYRAFSQLAVITDAKLRQDLIVNGSLSIAGALISIGVPAAFAIGGTTASIAGPVGLALGAALLLAGGIYSAVREVEEIEKVVHLTGWEKFHSGLLAFTGQSQKPSIANQMAYHSSEVAANKALAAQREQEATRRLQGNGQIGALYLSLGEPHLLEHHYKKITGTLGGVRRLIQDEVLPAEADGVITRFQTASVPVMTGYHSMTMERYRDVHAEPSEYIYYEAKRKSSNDSVRYGHLSSQVLKKSFIGALHQVGSFVDPADSEALTAKLNPRQNDHKAVMGDFNGDGQPDIGYFSAQGFYLLRADGQGGYAPRQWVSSIKPIIWSTRRTLVGDIDGDGLDDMVVIGDDHHRIRILLAQADGTFIDSEQTDLPLSRLDDAVPVLVDINRDGRADLVSFTRSQSASDFQGFNDHPGEINISYGTAAGRFETIPALSISALYAPQDIPFVFEVAARRPEGETDERRQLRDSANTRSQQRGGFKGEGYRSTLPALAKYNHRLAGDINGDGYGDIVSVTATGAVYTLLGGEQIPLRALSAQQHEGIKNLGQSLNTAQIQLTDINGDGRADLLVIGDQGDYTIAYGQSDGTFGAETRDKWREENGEIFPYRQNKLAHRRDHQILGIDRDPASTPRLLSLNALGTVNAHPITSFPITESIAWFSLGGGNDSAEGDRDCLNFFEVGEDRKLFTGERKGDSFLLMGKAAPAIPSRLTGGPASSAAKDREDRVIAAVALPNEGYRLDLLKGEARYKNSKALIAHLSGIEHAYGHSETDDELIGNEADNILNGQGGHDILEGNGGNDTLILSAGTASGGIGIDTYRILQHQPCSGAVGNTEVVITETEEGEHSNVLLDYDVANLAQLSLQANSVEISLCDDQQKHSELSLENMYRLSADGKQKNLQHHYRIYTRDGVLISGWPETLHQDAAGNWPPLRLRAQYVSEMDQTRRSALKGMPSADIEVHSCRGNGQGQIIVKAKGQVIGQTTTLPSFLSLALVGTKWSNEIIGDEQDNLLSTSLLPGDEENNRLWHRTGQDTLRGNGGSDSYYIGRGARNICINNQDVSSVKGGKIAIDNVIVPWLINQIALSDDGDDIILTHRTARDSNPTVRISKFKQSEQYRHLWIQANNGDMVELCIDANRNVSLGRQVVTTEGNDHIVVRHETMLIGNKLALGAGRDVFLDTSDVGYQISGGKDDDNLQGGRGDDRYQYALGDGHDILCDRGGQDRLEFSSINKEQLWLQKSGEDLKVLIQGTPEAGSVIIKNYYTDTASKIETLSVSGYQLVGSNIDALAQAMTGFSSPESSGALPVARFNSQLSSLWLAVPA